jgi:hypothetical protein
MRPSSELLALKLQPAVSLVSRKSEHCQILIYLFVNWYKSDEKNNESYGRVYQRATQSRKLLLTRIARIKMK